MENWREIGQHAVAIWTLLVIFISIMPSMLKHTRRLFISMGKRNADFYEGHAYVNIFAEALRLFRVPEAIIKVRIGGRYGLPHFLATLPPFSIVFGVIMLGMYISSRKRR